MSSKPRIGILGLSHESNDFSVGITEFEHFERSTLLGPDQLLDFFRGGHHAISGFIEVLESADVEVVPLFHAGTTPGPVVSAAALDRLWGLIRQQVQQAGPLDGIMLSPHGAAMSQHHRDMDGWWLTELRKLVGDQVLLVGTLDPHVNLTSQMLKVTNAMLPYRENPHLDSRQRGVKAARLMLQALAGDVKLVQRAAMPPIQISIDKQHTGSSPLLELCQACEQAQQRPGVLDASVVLGFPYADLAEMGSGIQVVTDGDAQLAEQVAVELAQQLWNCRQQYELDRCDEQQAIDRARSAPKPACLLDMGDNVGGGGSGEGTWLLHALDKHRDLKTFFVIYDPQAAEQAIAAGLGNQVELNLAGRGVVERDGSAFCLKGQVVNIPPETYEDPKPRHGGRRVFQIGRSALVQSQAGHLHVLITSRRSSPNSARIMTNCGQQPGDYDIIVAKGVNAPLGAFDGACPTFIKVNTRGAASADLAHFTYHNRRRPMFPFEKDIPIDWPATLL